MTNEPGQQFMGYGLWGFGAGPYAAQQDSRLLNAIAQQNRVMKQRLYLPPREKPEVIPPQPITPLMAFDTCILAILAGICFSFGSLCVFELFKAVFP